MKVVKFLLSVILLISFNLHSQSTYIPMSTGDKFNERGYMQSSSKSISNNEIISDYDGNLSIVYTSPIDVPNGMGGDVTVTYNANVGHRMFLNDINSWSWVNEYGYPVNAPEWIIGYKGFALQTLNFEANFYSHKLNDSVNIQNMQGEETPLLIPGYSYTNKVGNTIDGLPPNYANIDYITLLLSDGSIMTLNNTTDGRVGTYVSSSFDDYTYGVVQLLGNNSYELRKMYLKRGDGLTYYFEEEMTDYYEIINFKSNLDKRYPRTMYLKKVFSPNGDTLSFVYQYVFPQNIGNNHYGRKIFERMITNNGSTFIGANFYLDYITFGFMGDGDIRQIKIFNCSNGDYFCLNIIKTSQGADWFSQIRSNSNTENSKIRYLSSIIIPGGKEDHFGYLRTSKKYRRTALIDDFNFKAPLYKLSNIEYDNGRKTEFAYLDHKPDTPFGFIESGTTATYSEFLRQTQRDCESNLMISRVKKYNKFDGDVFEYQTDYYSYGCPRDWYDPTTPSVHNIWTKITTNNSVPLDSSSPPSVSTTRYFSKYIAGFATSWHGDFTSVIRMEKEVISSASNSMKTSYTFDEGNFNNNGNNYDGTFWLKYKTITDSNFVSGDTFVKTTNYDDYTYQSFNFNPNHAHPYFSKRYKTVEKEIDPYGVITEKRFTSVIPSFSNVSAPFKMNLLNELKIYKGDSIKKIVDYVYNTYNNGSFGKLVRETNYINSRPLVTDYSYYLTGLAPSTYTYLYPNLYKWHLKETVFPNGIKEKYSYTSQEMKIDTFMYDPGGWQGNTYFPPRFKYYASLSLTGKVVLTNGVVKDSSIKCQGGVYSSKPLRTALINGTDSLVYYKLYDDDGNVINEVDVNGFYSEFFYDELGRIKKANLPGSFPASNKIYIDTSVVRYDGYSNINRHYIIGTDSTISPDGEIRIESYGGGAPTQLPDALIENDAKSKDMEQPDGPGDPPAPGEIKPNKYYYGFLKQPIITTNIVSIESASLTLKMAWAALSEGQQSNFDIYGITQDYNLGNLTYQTMGKITVNFVGNTTNSVNVSSILNTIKNNNKNLYGFKFVASVEGNGNDAYKVFLFSNTDTIYLNFSINVLDIDTSNTAGSVLCSYNDNDNKVAITKRFNFDLLNPKNEKSLIEYDALGQLRRKKIMGSNGYEVKADIISNYLGLKSELKDGLSRNQYFKYDDFSRPINQIFISNSPSSPKKTFSYQPSAVFEINTITDETNKSVKKYFDKVGNLKKEEKFNGTTPLTTTYIYDNLYRLTSVVTPMGKTTSYLYDDHSNISQKTSPDEGTTKYRYDKYGNLRFSLNIGAPATEKALNFTKYDQFNRLIASGLLISTFGFDQLNADLDYSTNQGSITHFENFNTDTANFVVANMYDKYVKTGIFTNMPNPHLASFISGKNLKGKLVATAFRDKPGDPWSYKVYTYDYLGRVHYYWVKIGDKNWRVVINEYDNLGNTIKQNINNEFYVWYDYDEQGRLQEVRSSIHNTYTTAILDAVYTYDKSDKIKSSEFGTRVKPKMNYTYDAKGRVTDLNGIATDMFTTQFRETLTYFDNDNIESMYLQNTGNGSWSNLSFSYVYDGLNRLRNSNCNNASFSEAFNYNDDGNFTSKNKSGLTMSYNYVTNTNKINYVKFNTVDKYYSHDYRGNIVSDGNKGLSIINYDRRNLILSFIKSGQTNYYRYDDNGNRIYKGIYNQPKEYYFRDHTGKELGVYDLITGRIKMLNLYGNGLFGKVNVRWDSTLTETDPGTWEYVFNRTDERQFYFKDHLGSIRMTIDAATFDITGAQDYYPYGEVLRSYVTGGNINDKYKFTEKERDTETGYDYFPPGRTYDSEFGRWLQADPLNQYHSPYIYCGNNPLRIKDNDGKYGEDVHHDLTYYMAVFVMGVSGNVASEIANANQGVDININTRSENPLMWDNSLHFTSPLSIKVCDNLYNNNATLSNELFGASLHSFMDINFSHWGFFAVNSDGTLGHLNQMEVDKVARNNKLKGSSSQMIKAVYELMKQRNGGKAKISFEDLLKNLNNYITEYGDFQGIDKTVGENPKSSNDNKRAKHSWFVDPIQDWDDRYSPRN